MNRLGVAAALLSSAPCFKALQRSLPFEMSQSSPTRSASPKYNTFRRISRAYLGAPSDRNSAAMESALRAEFPAPFGLRNSART
jgi:hypothetical protein